MPLVYQQNINESTRLGVWHILEPEHFFLDRVPLGRNITHPQKRLQHLAGRYLLPELFSSFPVDLIKVAETRRPFLEDDAFHFSISHGAGFAAAIVSKNHRVGIDIEIPHQKIERISEKFLTSDELALIKSWPASYLHQLTLAWSIKESLFKWYAHAGVDFRKDLRIISVSGSEQEYQASCLVGRDEKIPLQATGQLFHSFALTYVMD